MRYRVERRLRRGEMVWAILKDGQYYGSTRSYLQAFKMVNVFNENSELTPTKIAKLEEVSRESYRQEHLSNVRDALKGKNIR